MRGFIVVVALLLLPVAAVAQESGPEVVAGFGVGSLHDDEGSLGGAVEVRGGAGYRWRGRIGVEALVSRLHANRQFLSGVEFDATLVRLSGRVLYHFSPDGEGLYAGGGLGVSGFERTSLFPIVEPGPDGRPVRLGSETLHREGTGVTWSGAAGWRFRAGQHVYLRPEVELVVTRPDNFAAIVAALHVGWAL